MRNTLDEEEKHINKKGRQSTLVNIVSMFSSDIQNFHL